MNVEFLPLIPGMPLNCSFGFTSKILHLPSELKTCRRATDLSRRQRILLEPISQLLNLSIHQSVDSLYLFLLVRRNWPLSFELFNKISPSFIPPCPPQPLSFALNCREVLCVFFPLFFPPRQDSLLDTAVRWTQRGLGLLPRGFFSRCWSVLLALCQVGCWGRWIDSDGERRCGAVCCENIGYGRWVFSEQSATKEQWISFFFFAPLSCLDTFV